MVPWLSVQFLSWAMDRRAGCTQQHQVVQCPTLPVLHPLLWWWAGKMPAPMLEGQGQRPWVTIRPAVTLGGAFLKYHTRIQNLKYQEAFENKILYFTFLFWSLPSPQHKIYFEKTSSFNCHCSVPLSCTCDAVLNMFWCFNVPAAKIIMYNCNQKLWMIIIMALWNYKKNWSLN